MEYYFLFLLLFLALVAVFDIFVGVSNDAVNFLNSALGCRIASFKTVMIVASLGVMLGATFSSGMMEIARSGVFNPQMFTFSEIMVIFFAVMVTDIILLDAFNSLGLPTSTTVSIVFELLGSALAAAAYTLMLDGASLADVAQYINSSRSLTIVSGILISVVVAFVSGTVVQYIARLIFTFNFEKVYRRVGGVYAGFCLTAIFYFLVMKGAKGASFMQPEWIQYMDANTLPIVTGLFVILSIVFQILIVAMSVNIFKVVILAGTFSLAFAFAGILIGIRMKCDPVGIFVLAFSTAFGGGIVRDLLIDRRPMYWIANQELVWLVLLSAFCTDIFAYFTGVFLGKHKLCPNLSPKKTIEGAIGGTVGSIVCCGLFGRFLLPLVSGVYSAALPDMTVHCLIIGLIGAIMAQCGDLTASAYKRKMGIKDYGTLIPGHGGIMDRFDSVLFTAPVVYYYIVLVLM